MVEDHYKTSILPTGIHLKTAHRSPVSLMGKVTLHFCIVDFKFFHTFIIFDKLPEAAFLFGINLQKKYSLYYCWDLYRQLFMQRRSIPDLHRNSEQHYNVAVIKSTLKIPPRHNGSMPIEIKGHDLKDHMAYFISNQHRKKGLSPNIHVLDGIYNIKDKLTLHIVVENYTNKHVTFNQGQCIGHVESSINNMPQTSVNSIMTQKMMDEQVQPDTFKLPLHIFFQEIKQSLDTLLETFKSKFVWDETSVGTTHLTDMQIDTGTTEPVSQRPSLFAMKQYEWPQNKINKLYHAKVIHSRHSSCSDPIIIVHKGDGGECLIINCKALNKVTRKFIWPMPKVKTHFI